MQALQSALGLRPGELGYRLGAAAGRDALLVSAALMSTGPVPKDGLQAVAHGAEQEFPIAAADLMPALSGPELGATLKRLEQDWIDSGFGLS